MAYKLKPNVPDFTVVDGTFEGRSYKAGETYDEIPPQEKNKFESIPVSKEAEADTEKGGKKK